MLSERLRQHCLKKILCNFALILLGKHCTGQNLMQCCPKSSRQHCIRRNSVQCCLNTLWTTLHSWKPYAMLPKRLQTTLLKKNVPFNVSSLCSLGPMQCCPMLQASLHGKNYRQFRQYHLNNIWWLCLHMYISGPFCQKNTK